MENVNKEFGILLDKIELELDMLKTWINLKFSLGWSNEKRFNKKRIV